MKGTHLSTRTTLLIVLVALLVLCFVATAILSANMQAQAYSADPSATVGEIFIDNAETGGMFDYANMQRLINALAGSSSNNASIDSLKTLASAEEERSNSTNTTGENGNSVTLTGTPMSDKNIVVEFGGIKWIAVYLTTADTTHGSSSNGNQPNSGDVILTLWQAYADDSTKAKWNNYGANADGKYPANMYGTSFMRAVVLNNGGEYAIDKDNLTTAKQQTTNTYAKFNMATYGEDSAQSNIRDFLVAPRYLDWQYDQNRSTMLADGEATGYMNNESWGLMGEENYHNPSYWYEEKDNYSAWQDDLIWLPSWTETGNGTGSGGIGIWKSKLEWTTSSGTNTWLRSAGSDSYYYVNNLISSGAVKNNVVSTSNFLVRPALHLNLTAAAANVTTDYGDATQIGEIFVDNANTGGEFNQANLQQLISALGGGSGNVTVNSLKSLANADDKRANSSNTAPNGGTTNTVTLKGTPLSDKNIIVEFGGIKWFAVYLTTADTSNGTSANGNQANNGDVILTLWQAYADDATKTVWNKYGTNNTDGKGTYPANMYGTSYIRTQILNNQGTYYASADGADPTTVYQSTINTYAKFQMQTYIGGKSNISKYIVAPRYVGYQYDQNRGAILDGNSAHGYINNESWGKYGASKFHNTSYCYESSANYSDWADDLVWLPSWTETGNAGGSDGMGIWKINAVQGSSQGTTWLRSAFSSIYYSVNSLDSDGIRGSNVLSTSEFLVRPALHLNLSAAAESVEHNYEYKDDGAGNHYQQCTLCGQETEHQPHTVVAANPTGDSEHTGLCTVCKLTVTENHATTQRHNQLAHWDECSVCNARLNETQHNWSDLGWEKLDNSTHKSICTTCNETVTENHVLGKLLKDDAGYYQKCTANGCTYETERQDLDEKHEHAFSLQKSDENYHWKECECGARSDVQKHEGTTWNTDGNNHYKQCATCNTKYSNGEHVMTYHASGVNKHYQQCEVCNHTTSAESHQVVYAKYTDGSQHTGLCAICNLTASESHVQGMLQHNQDGHWNTCTVCSGRVNEVTHEWSGTWQQAEGYHYKICDVCQEELHGEHSATSWTDSRDGNTHRGQCVCGKELTAEHTLGSLRQDSAGYYQKCTATGCNYETERQDVGDTHIHTYTVQKYDENYHWDECPCGARRNVTQHDFGSAEWTATDNATHTATCVSCGKTVEKAHNFELTEDEQGYWLKCDSCSFETEKSLYPDPTPSAPTPSDPEPEPEDKFDLMDWFDNTPLPLGYVAILLGVMLVMIIILAIAARKPKKY